MTLRHSTSAKEIPASATSEDTLGEHGSPRSQRHTPCGVRAIATLVARVVLIIAVLVMLRAALALPGVAPVRASPSWADVSLDRGWAHHPIAGLIYGGGCCPDQIVAGGPGLVAYERLGGGAQIYASTTGRDWKRLPGPTFGPDESPNELFIVGQRLIITGGSTSNGRFVPRIWVSTNGGQTWRKPPAQLQIRAVIPGADGLIAFVDTRSSTQDWITQLWTSADGLTWRQLPDANGAFASANVHSVTKGGRGYVAGGTISETGRPIRATIWTSPDGVTWTEVPDAGRIFAGSLSIYQMVAGPAGVAAVGEVGVPTFRDAIWASRDGIHWQRAADDFITAPEGIFPLPLAVWQRGFAEINNTGTGAELYSSSDGLTWTRVGSDSLFGGTASVESMISFRGGFAALGGVAAHPPAQCLQDGSSGFPVVPRLSVLLWTPTASRTARAPTIDSTDPWTLRLLPQDLPAGYYQGQYTNLCSYLPALGQHRAYLVRFAGFAAQGLAMDIVTQRAAAATAAFHQVDRLVRQVPWVTSVEPVVKVQRMRELRPTARIGDETRVFAIHVKDYECGDLARTAADLGPLDCSTYYYKSDVVVWRHRRVIGMVVTDKGWSFAMELARRLLVRSEHPFD